MFNANPVLAAFDPQWIFPALVIVVLIIRIIGVAIGGNNPNVPNRRPPGQAPRMPAPQGGDNDTLKGEIEEFLRRVSNRREGQPAQRTAASPQRPGPAQRPPTTNAQDRRRKPAPVIIATAGTPVLAEVVETTGSRDDIGDHVKRYLNTREFDQRAGHLTNIDEKERQFDRQIQQTFAHEVGHLKPSSLAPPADDRSVSETAPQVVNEDRQNNSFALLTGSNLINAVIVSEIMQRPEHRW